MRPQQYGSEILVHAALESGLNERLKLIGLQTAILATTNRLVPRIGDSSAPKIDDECRMIWVDVQFPSPFLELLAPPLGNMLAEEFLRIPVKGDTPKDTHG